MNKINKRKKRSQLKDAVGGYYGKKTLTAVLKAVPTNKSANDLALVTAGPASVKLVVGALEHLQPALGVCPISYLPNNDLKKVVFVSLIPGAVGGHFQAVHQPTWDIMRTDVMPFGNGHKRGEWRADMVFKLPESQHPSSDQFADLIGEGEMTEASIAFQKFADLLQMENEAAKAKAAANAKKAEKQAEKQAEEEAAAKKAEEEAAAKKAVAVAIAAANEAVAYAQAAKEAHLQAKEAELNNREAVLDARDSNLSLSPEYPSSPDHYLPTPEHTPSPSLYAPIYLQ